MDICRVDLDELANAFPDRARSPEDSIPPLLKTFGTWLNGEPWELVGAFDLSVKWSDYYFPGGEHFYDDFALFIRFPEGSAAGFWLPDQTEIKNAPIVLLDSEGQFETLAANLESVLAGIALGTIPRFATEFETPDGLALRNELSSVLSSALGVENLDSLASKTDDLPDFPGWAEAEGDRYEAEIAAHPEFQALASLLDKYRPTGGNAWETQGFDVSWAGDCFEVMIHDYGPKPFAEDRLVIPHLANIRTEAANKTPGLGLWHGAMFSLSGDGSMEIRPNYLYEPEFHNRQPSTEDYRSDQNLYPKVARRIPDWLRQKLQAD